MATKRQKIMKLLTETLDILDPSGYNTKKYIEEYARLNDNDFNTKIKELLDDPDANLYLEFTPFENDLSMNAVKDAADYLGIELDEYVAMPFINPEGKVYTTPVKVPVGYVHIKRLQQLLEKKNSFTIDTSERSATTGLLMNDSRSGRVSDMETYALLANGINVALKEFMSSRADDKQARDALADEISAKGYVSLEEIPDEVENKTALNTLEVYLTGASLITDLTTKGLVNMMTYLRKHKRDLLGNKYM